MATTSLKETFRLARKRMGLSQNQLAEKLGVVNTTIRNYEKGRREPEPHIIWNFSNIAPPEFQTALRGFVPESFLRSVEKFVLDTNVLLKAAEHPRRKNRRISDEAVTAMHQALDVIIDGAPSDLIVTVDAYLKRLGGTFGIPEERGGVSPAGVIAIPLEQLEELNRLSTSRRLDTSTILRGVLESGIEAVKLKFEAERQASGANREAQQRVNPRKKTK